MATRSCAFSSNRRIAFWRDAGTGTSRPFSRDDFSFATSRGVRGNNRSAEAAAPGECAGHLHGNTRAGRRYGFALNACAAIPAVPHHSLLPLLERVHWNRRRMAMVRLADNRKCMNSAATTPWPRKQTRRPLSHIRREAIRTTGGPCWFRLGEESGPRPNL
jgi:hypothetical protein